MYIQGRKYERVVVEQTLSGVSAMACIDPRREVEVASMEGRGG